MMDRDEILQLLRDELSVEVDIGFDYGYHGNRIQVTLKLGGETISETRDSMPEARSYD
jgi:hypothetical protein